MTQNNNDSKPSDANKTSNLKYSPTFWDKSIMELLAKIDKEGDVGRVGILIRLRSPESMVRYLGEIIALQHLNEKPFSPTLYIDTVDNRDEEAEVFPVLRGSGALGNAAFTIRDDEGETFSIPKPDYRRANHHLGLEALSLVADTVNAAVSLKSIPQVTSFTLTPGLQ